MDKITFALTGPTILRLTLFRKDGHSRSVPFKKEQRGRIVRLLEARGWVFVSWCDMGRPTETCPVAL